MDLSELESLATELLDQERLLQQLDQELHHIQFELREQPRRSARESKFARLIGLEWHEPELRRKTDELTARRNSLAESLANNRRRFLEEFTSPQLTIPLELEPQRVGDAYVFAYRGGASFPKTLELLARLLGLSLPINIDAVTLSEKEVRVRDDDVYLAKEQLVDTITHTQKTLALKLPEKQPWT